jgi:hypothetical protein
VAVKVYSPDELAERAEARIAAFARDVRGVKVGSAIQRVDGDVESAKKAHRAATEGDLVSLLRQAAMDEDKAAQETFE